MGRLRRNPGTDASRPRESASTAGIARLVASAVRRHCTRGKEPEMLIESEVDAVQETASDLIRMLHREAAAEDFSDQLARVELLPENSPAKPGLVELVRMAMALRNRLDLWQQRESGMMAVIESARDLSSRLHLKELLRAIVSRARNM